MYQISFKNVCLLILALLLGSSGLFSQNINSSIDSLEIYDPFVQTENIRGIIRNYFSIMGEKNSELINHYTLEIKEAKKKKNFAQIGNALVKIGEIYFQSSIYSEALRTYYEALKNYEKNGDSLNAALVKIKLGQTYYFADLVPSRDYLSEASQTLQNTDEKEFIALSLYVKGQLKPEDHNRDNFNKMALELQYEVLKAKPNDKTVKENLARYLNVNGHLEQAIKISEEIENNLLLVIYLNNYGFQKVQEGKYDDALIIFKRSLKICKEERYKTFLRNTYENIGRVYRLKGDWKKSAQFQQLMHLIEESLYTERFTQQMSENKVKYETEKREIENSFLKKEKALLANQVSLQKNLNILLTSSITIILIILFVVFRGKRRLAQVNAVLDIQNNEISAKKNELEKLNTILLESEKNLKEAQETANLANWEYNISNQKLSFSDQFIKIFNLENENLKNTNHELICRNIYEHDKLMFENFISNTGPGMTQEFEFRIYHNKTMRWVKAKRKEVKDENGNLIQLVGTVQDITEIKEEEKTKIRMAEQQSFNRKLIRSQEKERKRIAGELHDGLGQELILIKNRALLGLQNEQKNDFSRAQFKEIDKLTSLVLESIREISFNLRPAHLERIGLTEVIKSTVQKADKLTAINIRSEIENIDNLLSNEDEINFFRIVQEGINNILKHSGAKNASVIIIKNANGLNLKIKDDGKGFEFSNVNKKLSGFGLVNLVNRVQLLNGNIDIKTNEIEGTCLEIFIPVKTNEQEY